MEDPSTQSGSARRVWSGFAQERARGAFTSWRGKPTLGEKVIGLLVLALAIGLVLLILIPAIALGLVALVVGGSVVAVRRAWRRVTGGKRREASGRENVRVIARGGRA